MKLLKEEKLAEAQIIFDQARLKAQGNCEVVKVLLLLSLTLQRNGLPDQGESILLDAIKIDPSSIRDILIDVLLYGVNCKSLTVAYVRRSIAIYYETIGDLKEAAGYYHSSSDLFLDLHNNTESKKSKTKATQLESAERNRNVIRQKH